MSLIIAAAVAAGVAALGAKSARERALAEAGVLTPHGRQRLVLMYRALRIGMALEGEVDWWPALAPLKRDEREAVWRELRRMTQLDDMTKHAELLRLERAAGIAS